MEINPRDIVLFHVGGSVGGFGPIDLIVGSFPRQCVVFCFEARADENDSSVANSLTPEGVRINSINAFIGEEDGKPQEFLINKHPDSSSEFPPNPEVCEEIVPVPYIGIPTWGENTILDRRTIVKTASLRKLIADYGVVPDVLSIDAQGSELRILRGTGPYLQKINALVSEVEFFEIYKGQGLYADQAMLLNDYGFRLVDVLSLQYWHPELAIGQGLLTVGEAVWFKRLNAFFLERTGDAGCLISGIKYAAIAYSFRRYSFARLLLKKLMEKYGEDVTIECKKSGYDAVLSVMNMSDVIPAPPPPEPPSLRRSLVSRFRRFGSRILDVVEGK